MHQWLDRYAPLPLDGFDHTSGRHVITATVQEPMPDDWGPRVLTAVVKAQSMRLVGAFPP